MGVFYKTKVERNQMKILHVITSLEIGGAQRLLADLLPLQATTEKVTLLVYVRVGNDIEKSLEQAGITIISLDEHNFHNPGVVFRLRKLIKNYDLVHAHLFPTIYWASLAARALNIKLVYTEHSTSNSRRGKWYFRPVERFMYGRYDKIISISQQTQDALTSWLNQHDSRFVVINNGVDIKRFSSVAAPVEHNSLIMVSRFASSKDQETVIRSMQYIKDATLRFVGDGPNRVHCEEIAKDLGLSERIKFLGTRSDVPELVASSYIGIQSSNWEGFGLTAVELMAAGKPVLATDVDGLKQVVEGAGEIFHLGDARGLAAKISHLLNDKDYYCIVAKRCKERAKEYDISAMDMNYKSVYYTI